MSSISVRWMIVAGLFVPPLVYPCLTGALWVLDSTVGDRVVVHYFLYESRWRLLAQLLSDWGHALPALYGVVLVLWLPAFYGLNALGIQRAWAMATVGGVAGYGLAWFLVGTPGSSAAMALSLVGALIGWMLTIIASMGTGRQEA